MKIHFDWLDAKTRARNFCMNAQRDSFVGLNSNDEHVLIPQIFIKENSRRFFEVDGNLSGRFRKAFPDTHVNRYIGPAPVVDEQAQCHKSFCLGIRLHVWFLTITGNRLAIDRTLGVLATHNVRSDLTLRETAKGSDDFDFFVTNTIRAQVHRRLHCDKTKKLEQMVLHHVAQGAGALVKTGATFNSQSFGGRDLDVIDVMRIPKRRENRVRESQDQNVLRGFFSQKMIDSVSLLFGKGIADDAVKFSRRSEIRAEGFFNDDAGPASFTGFV